MLILYTSQEFKAKRASEKSISNTSKLDLGHHFDLHVRNTQWRKATRHRYSLCPNLQARKVPATVAETERASSLMKSTFALCVHIMPDRNSQRGYCCYYY